LNFFLIFSLYFHCVCRERMKFDGVRVEFVWINRIKDFAPTCLPFLSDDACERWKVLWNSRKKVLSFGGKIESCQHSLKRSRSTQCWCGSGEMLIKDLRILMKSKLWE
jgi:hypothetical protein